MSLQGLVRRHPRVGFPRVSGDEPKAAQAMEDQAQFSPRERG